MFTSLTLASILLVTLSECSLNIERSAGGEIRFSRNEDRDVSSQTSSVSCGLRNRLSEHDRFNVAQLYNMFRVRLNSSAMYNTKWSKTLANYAQEKADKCDIGFSFPSWCDANDYTSLGGFTYKENEVAPIAGFLQSMYSEKKLYRVGYNSCRMDGGCKLFKYLARDTISEFGCAVTKCGVLTMSDGSELNNMLRIVCYYAHGTNLHHVPSDRTRPYSITGAGCSKCNALIRGANRCVFGLCEDNCTTGRCVCNYEKKCPFGFFNKDTCECECNKGFFGEECEYPCRCVNTISDCSVYSNLCSDTQYTNYIRTICSAECPRVCKIIKPAHGLKSCQE